MKFNSNIHFFFHSFCSFFFKSVVSAVLIVLSRKSARINRYHKKESLLFVRIVPFLERYVQICVQTVSVRVAFCLVSLMVFESACVSSHFQEKEKVAAAVGTVSVLLFLSRLWDVGRVKGKINLFLWNRSETTVTVKTEIYLHNF